MKENRDLTFEAFRQLVPYLRGALWWAHNDLIKERQKEFNQCDDHVGHPMLSVRKIPIENRYDVVPMLVGTTGRRMSFVDKARCVMVSGITQKDPDHKTYFGSIVMPGLYSFGELLLGVRSRQLSFKATDRNKLRHREDEKGYIIRSAWCNDRTMCPNEDKPMVSDEEMRQLNSWCESHHLGG